MEERKAAVLRAVVESFVETAQPVGSRAVADLAGLDVSTATIRNEMSALEVDGYLHQPHTSAGRVPTEKGYRYFVDALGPGQLDATEMRQVRGFFSHAQGEIEQRLHDTSMLLSTLTDYAAVVLGPAHDPATIRSVQLVDLDGARVLLVLVLSSGTVERHMMELEEQPTVAALQVASYRLEEALVGTSAGTAMLWAPSGDPAVDVLLAEARRCIRTDEPAGELYVGGTANMAVQFDAVVTVRQVLAVLEEQLLVVSLLHDLVERGLSVAIGSETGLEPLSQCAVVVAPYDVDGQRAGSIGVLGPTRMDYPKALAAVHLVSSRLGASLGDGGED